MSSFIVDKKEFIKAAGLMYGIEESKRDAHRYFLEVCRQEFVHCYLLNVISVNEQYGEDYAPDEASYDEEFEEYRRLARTICERDMVGADQSVHLRDLRMKLWHFFGSVLYQIENKTCDRTASAWFYTCLVRLYEREIHSVDGWHGSIDLKEELEKLTPKVA